MNVLWARDSISLEEIFKSTFSNTVTIGQKDIILTKNEVQMLEKKAEAKIDSNKIRFYIVKEGEKIEGYAVLMIKRVRTKKAAILYLITKDAKIKNIEIIAFHEPSEYKPYSTWKEIFIGKSNKDDLRAGYGIPSITGATLSARAVSNAARIALAIVEKELHR